ncbi:serine/threonine-protein kinase [Actinophytocola oryzae]|uniref:non-specific serine/threonine protein kinase n=1 Tax=Actinophytocola oryzae TaxID=502181 RepID=A0A4R7VZF4_9PSEU|nr:serine/threonine-protein kinase [Actinophytocola oryzae]TDV54939.1 serine/threonine protein kinase [Actinophytocola oryzae]
MADRLVGGRYRILARLGQGGMGVVWRAHDELLRRDVAVKELHVRLGWGADDASARGVLREARAAAGLRHPGVVAVHDVVVEGSSPLIVMELVEGPSLAQVLKSEGSLPETRVATMGLRLLRALEAAHRRGIVHRDVKPANVMLDGDRVVLTDFGIAAGVGDTTVTDAGGVLGSPEYLAPERVNGGAATPASDLWSLAATLCAALRGVSPFQRSDTQATLAAVLTYEPPPIPQAPRLWPLLNALLRKDPRERPTATAASAALALMIEPDAEPLESVTDHVEPLPPPPPHPRGRRPMAALVAVCVLAAATVAGLVAFPGTTPVGGSARGSTTLPPPPPGFETYHGDGFSVAVPEGWLKESDGSEVFWTSSANSENSLIAHVMTWEQRPSNAMSILTEFEETEFATLDVYSNYERLRLEDRTAPDGMTCAELEVTYHVSLPEGQLDPHDLLHAVVTEDGRVHLLSVAAQTVDPGTTEQLWQQNKADLAAILDSFRVDP